MYSIYTLGYFFCLLLHRIGVFLYQINIEAFFLHEQPWLEIHSDDSTAVKIYSSLYCKNSPDNVTVEFNRIDAFIGFNNNCGKWVKDDKQIKMKRFDDLEAMKMLEIRTIKINEDDI